MKNKAAKVWEIVAWSVAGVVLVGALGYYNFIDKAPVSGVEVGNRCPDFTAQTYVADGDTFYLDGETFTLSQQIGKVCVVNFWETWCSGCIKELPEFDHLKKTYGDKVEVIAIAGVTSTTDYAASWMTDKGWTAHNDKYDWTDFDLTIAWLPKEKCVELGCGGSLPRTVIVDKSGIVAFEGDVAMTYELLETEVLKLL